MIRAVTVTNHMDESITFDLVNPEKSGFYIREITGLGPPKANINTTEMATSDGSIYNSARAMSRNIVLTLGFLFMPDIESVRQLSYKYFPLKKRIKLTVQADHRTGATYGYVESNEPDIFSNQQTTQISVICPDPHFYAPGKSMTSFTGVTALFEFPFSNESLTKDLIEFGEMSSGPLKPVHYDGDTEIGVTIFIDVFGEVSDITIYEPETNRRMVISEAKLAMLTGSGLTEGDQLIITTMRGDKGITLIREGVSYNVLNALNRDAFWFKLTRGSNLFAYTADSGLAFLDFRIENGVAYEGM